MSRPRQRTPAASDNTGEAPYEGRAAADLAALLRLPRVVTFGAVGSTLDVAHTLGEAGAPAGTLVLAETQSAGRGRFGRSWHSEPGRGIWLTLVERPAEAETLEVLSLRLGLHAAAALAPFAEAPVQLKWPNDLQVEGRKLAGILVEARWREARLDWVAVGLGVNVRPPTRLVTAGRLAPGTDRVRVLQALVPALRGAVLAHGRLTPTELAAYAGRDAVRGRRCVQPVAGTVAGIDAEGALLVDTAEGRRAVRTGSLVIDQTGEGKEEGAGARPRSAPDSTHGATT